jgi:hypothetical protein
VRGVLGLEAFQPLATLGGERAAGGENPPVLGAEVV